ncbi:MAG: GNAT family N-acetyltransferase [Paracoccaceae bacterium]
MRVTYHNAAAGDGEAIALILSIWIDETSWMPRIHNREQDQAYGAWLIEVTDVSVARVQGVVIGFLSRQERDIQALYLAPTARGQGVGRRLLELAKEHSDRLGLWTFQANMRARRFYAQNGFVEDQMTDGQGNDEKLPDLHMSWVRD